MYQGKKRHIFKVNLIYIKMKMKKTIQIKIASNMCTQQSNCNVKPELLS